MRLASLEVAWFQGVKSAQLDFGPGLNVLYGPNDLGKSTLATAIRAALLLQAGSSEADAFHSWHADEKPSVTLVFVDGSGRYWRVKKTFGGSAGAQLWQSKDGQEWTTEAKAREVDERLRTLLPWGIPSPGGRGAPRGLPQSFLVNALLGAQDEVDTILDMGLDKDLTDSGKVALTHALSALAQDPLFKKVLTVAQREFDAFFTEKGKRRTGQASGLTAANEAVKRLQVDREALEKKLEEAQAIEAQAGALRERRAEAALELERAKERLSLARAGFAKSQARQAAAEKVAVAEAALARIDAQAQRVADAGQSVVELQRGVQAAEMAWSRAKAARNATAEAVRAAEAKASQAASEDAARKQALERAQLEAKAATLREDRGRLLALREKAAAAVRAQASLTEARGEVTKRSGEGGQLSALHTKAKQTQEDAQSELDLAEGIVAYGRWRVAHDAAQGAAEARAEAAKLRSRALGQDVQAQQFEERAKVAEQEGAKAQAALPTAARLVELRRLAHEKEVAEAALGGGLSVVVRPRRPIAIRTVSDEALPVDLVALANEHTLEAERRVQLSLGDLVEVVVTAGAPETRRQVEGFRRRWKEEVLPVLQAAGAPTLADLETRLLAVGKHGQDAVEAREKAKAARAEAEALRGRATGLEQQVAPSREELEAKEARIGALSREVLGQFFVSMGASWEAQGEELRAAKTKELQRAREAVSELEVKRKEALWNLELAQKREAEASRELPGLLEALGGEAPASVEARSAGELEANAQSSAQVQAALEGFGAVAASAQEKAKADLAAALAALDGRTAEVTEAEKALTDARSRLDSRQGEVKALQAQLAELDRPGSAVRVEEARAVLAALEAVGLATAEDVKASEAALAGAQAAFDEANAAHLKADGAVTSLAGPAVKERAQQLDEAIHVARVRERELNVDADSWKLLRDALREAEKTESAHLGKALAAPVASRFAELTGGKYGALALDQALRMETVQVNGTQAAGDAVLRALSVGTRDQLATLVRLAVASQLKSAILLDDQLVHTDDSRLGWFSGVLRRTAEESQVLVFTCRPLDYARKEELAAKDLGRVRTVDLSQVVR